MTLTLTELDSGEVCGGNDGKGTVEFLASNFAMDFYGEATAWMSH